MDKILPSRIDQLIIKPGRFYLPEGLAVSSLSESSLGL